jgi:hypothetical protein
MALVYDKMTSAELMSLLDNAHRIAQSPAQNAKHNEAHRVIAEVNAELSRRHRQDCEASTKSKANLIWKKIDPYTNELLHNAEVGARIVQVANHSLADRDVYNAYIFGELLPSSFEYIDVARNAVTELVRRESNELRRQLK